MELVIKVRVDSYAQAQQRIRTETRKTMGPAADLQKLMGRLFAGFSAAIVLRELGRIVVGIRETGAMFQTLGLQLETQFGDRASDVFREIRKFALESPGQVSGITAAWIGLKSIGIEPTIAEMRALDDIASSSLNAATGQARRLEDLAEAIRGAITGETERLKAFNIIARQSGDEISLSYKDTAITVKKSAREIMDAIVQIGAINFPGAAQRQMNSYAGAASNLEDAIDSLQAELFDAGIGDLMTDIARGTTAFVDSASPGAVAAAREIAAALRDVHDVVSTLSSAGGGDGVVIEWLFGTLSRVSGLTNAAKALAQIRVIIAGLAKERPADGAAESFDRASLSGKRFSDVLLAGKKAAHETAKANAEVAKNLRSFGKIATDVKAAELAEEIQKQAEAMHDLLGKTSPGVDVLKKFAAAQIAEAEAAKAADRAQREHAQQLRENREIVDSLALSYNELREMIERAMQPRTRDFQSLNIAALGERLFPAPTERQMSAASEWAKQYVAIMREVETEAQRHKRVEAEIEIILARFPMLNDEQADAIRRARMEAAGLGEEYFKSLTTAEKLRDIFGDRSQQSQQGQRIEDDLLRVAGMLSDTLRNSGDDFRDALGDGLDAMIEMRNQGASWSAAMIVGAGAVVSAAASSAFGFTGQRGRGGFGGQMSGDFSDLGGDIGALIGSYWGPVGTAVGMVLGTIIGGAIKQGADQGIAELDQIANDIGIQILQNEGGLGDILGDVGRQIALQITRIEEILGAQINLDPGGGGGLGLTLADDKIHLFFNGVERIFTTVEEAVSAGVAMIIEHGEIGQGNRPEIYQALISFAGDTMQELDETLALALRLERGRLGPVRAEMEEVFRALFSDIAAGISRGIDVEGAVSTLARLRDEILGLEKDAGAQKAAEIDAYNAALDMHMLELEALALEIQARGDATQAQLISTKAYTQTVEGAILAEDARIQAMAAGTAATAAMAAGTADILARIAGVLADLDALRITGAQRAAAIARAAARRAGRSVSSGRGTGESAEEKRERLREEFRSILDALNETIQVAGESDFAGRLRQVTEGYADQRHRLEELAREHAITAQELASALQTVAEARAAELTGLQEELLLPFRDAVRDSGLDAQLQGIRDRAAEAAEQAKLLAAAAAADAASLADASGGLLSLDEALAIITAGMEAEMRQLGEQVAQALGIQEDAVGSWLDTLAFALENLDDLGLTLDQLGEAAADFVRNAVSGVASTLQRALPYIQDPVRRAAIEQQLIRLEETRFRLQIAADRAALTRLAAELELLGLLDEGMREMIASALGSLEGLEDAIDWEAFREAVLGAGEDFAGAVSGAAGAIQQAVSALPLLFPELFPVTSPPQDPRDIGLQLAQMLASIQGLENQASPLSPAERLMQEVERLAPFFAAFGLNLEEITAQVQALIDADIGQSITGLLSLRDELLFGSFSGLSGRDQIAQLRGRIMDLIASGQYQEAEQLLRQGLQMAQGVSGYEFAAFREFALGQIGRAEGTTIGGGEDPFAGTMNVFEQSQARRHREAQQVRYDASRDETVRLDAIHATLLRIEGGPSPDRPTLARRTGSAQLS